MTSQEFKHIRLDTLHGMTQQALAVELCTTRTSISRYETGRQAISCQTARLLQFVVAFHTEEAEAPTTPATEEAQP